MTGIILAAGVGSRLGTDIPKGLMTLPDGETIIGRQVRILKKSGVDRIVLVVGYRQEMMQERVTGVDFTYNPRYAETNTSKSLLCAIEDVDDDVLWVNGDVVFDEEIIPRILAGNDNIILVNSAECGEEEVKYSADETGIVREISKQVKDAHGEALGVNLIRRKWLKRFAEALEECDDNDYFERAVQLLIDRGVNFEKLDVPDLKCIEVDFKEDWDRAQGMFGGE